VTKEEYIKIIEPLIIVFGTPSAERLELDYEYFQYYTPETLDKMVNRIILNRKSKDYPTLAEMMDELDEIIKVPEDDKAGGFPDYDCFNCQDTGFIPVKEKPNTVTFCNCRLGKMKSLFVKFYREYHNYQDAKRAMNKKLKNGGIDEGTET